MKTCLPAGRFKNWLQR